MEELAALTAKRDGLLGKIREIDESCEGIENDNNARRVQELNLEKAQLSAQKQDASAEMVKAAYHVLLPVWVPELAII